MAVYNLQNSVPKVIIRKNMNSCNSAKIKIARNYHETWSLNTTETIGETTFIRIYKNNVSGQKICVLPECYEQVPQNLFDI